MEHHRCLADTPAVDNVTTTCRQGSAWLGCRRLLMDLKNHSTYRAPLEHQQTDMTARSGFAHMSSTAHRSSLRIESTSLDSGQQSSTKIWPATCWTPCDRILARETPRRNGVFTMSKLGGAVQQAVSQVLLQYNMHVGLHSTLPFVRQNRVTKAPFGCDAAG